MKAGADVAEGVPVHPSSRLRQTARQTWLKVYRFFHRPGYDRCCGGEKKGAAKVLNIINQCDRYRKIKITLATI